MTLWNKKLFAQALKDAVLKLNPLTLWRNPVMLLVEIGAGLTTIETLRQIGAGTAAFPLQISLWLWFTVLFATFAEAIAEGQGKARVASLRKARSELFAQKLRPDGETETVSALTLRKGDRVLVTEGAIIPGDGDITAGTALVDESAITGESAPVIRESGGDRSGVTGGTKVLAGTITITITANPGDTFLDNMIKMVEGAKRQKTPNEQALEILLNALTLLFLVVVVTLVFFANYMGVAIPLTILIALLVCLMPTTIGGLLPAIGIAGMDRLLQHNVIALSGRAIEAAGDVNVVLLDKTGTITLGNRMANEFIPAEGVARGECIEAALQSSLADETPEGRSIVVLAKKELGIHGRDIRAPQEARFVPFTPQTRMSGIDVGGRHIRKGSAEAIIQLVKAQGGDVPASFQRTLDNIAGDGDTPLGVVENARILGAIRLKDTLKEGIKQRLGNLREMGITSFMITGDNFLTAANIGAEAGVDDFIAEAKPETKLKVIREYQKMGYLVAMIGDGTNDAPALAQADVAVAMNAGTQAAREAANMVDLDSSPVKLLDIVEIGKEILITRGALTTFSIANDVSKYFAIVPALFASKYPQLGVLNIMHLANPQSAVLAAVIFNALMIPCLIPLALRGVKFQTTSLAALLQWNILIYGVGGLFLPFIGIKALDLIIAVIQRIL